MILSAQEISKGYADKSILQTMSMDIEENDRIGLIGVNGAGKTTLLRLLSGMEEPDTGTVSRKKDLTVGYLRQHSGLSSGNTIREEMRLVFRELLALEEELRTLEAKLSSLDPMDADYEQLSAQYAAKQTYFEQNDGYLIDVNIKTILNGMGFADKAMDTVIDTLSGGEKTRLALAKLLLERPQLLILDEPTNHLDFETLIWLEEYLMDYKGALLIVSHDRYFLDKLVTKIWDLERGKLTVYPGNYTKSLQLKEDARVRRQKEYELQQEHIAAMEDYIARNIVRATTSKSAKSRRAQLANMEIIEPPEPPLKGSSLSFTFEKQTVRDVLTVSHLDLAVGEGETRRELVHDISFEIKRGEKIALIGANGIGKSTLLKTLQGILPAPKGEIIWGKHVKISYYEQENANLNHENTVLEELWGRFPTLPEHTIRTMLGRVLLTGDNVYKKVGVVSGGERAKLAFAIIMMEHANVLLLDEPTNHLDLMTKEILEKALLEFEGTLLFVSHDRYFLNKIPTRIFEMHPDHIEIFDGNYDYYREKRAILDAKEAEEEAARKQQERAERAQQSKERAYRSRKQKSEEAALRRQVKALEEEIFSLEEQQAALEEEITKPEIYEDYPVMSEKCALLEQVKNLTAQKYEEWEELSSRLS